MTHMGVKDIRKNRFIFSLLPQKWHRLPCTYSPDLWASTKNAPCTNAPPGTLLSLTVTPRQQNGGRWRQMPLVPPAPGTRIVFLSPLEQISYCTHRMFPYMYRFANLLNAPSTHLTISPKPYCFFTSCCLGPTIPQQTATNRQSKSKHVGLTSRLPKLPRFQYRPPFPVLDPPPLPLPAAARPRRTAFEHPTCRADTRSYLSAATS